MWSRGPWTLEPLFQMWRKTSPRLYSLSFFCWFSRPCVYCSNTCRSLKYVAQFSCIRDMLCINWYEPLSHITLGTNNVLLICCISADLLWLLSSQMSEKAKNHLKDNLKEFKRQHTESEVHKYTSGLRFLFILWHECSNIHDIGYCSLNSLYFTVIYCWSISKIRETNPRTILHTYRKISPETQQHIKVETRKESLFWFHKVHIVKNKNKCSDVNKPLK